MSSVLNRFVGTIRDRMAEITRDRTRYLAADDQTRLSWARPATAYSEVPGLFQPFFDAFPPEEREPFPYAVISPSYKGFLQPEKEKLICRIDGNLYVVEQKADGLMSTSFPAAQIRYIETGSILLSSWFTICGIDSRGNPASTTLKFNSVTEHLFSPFVEWFRTVVNPAGRTAEPAAETSPFDALADVNFKFMNYGRKTVPPGEPVLQFVLQPEIRAAAFTFLGFSITRRIATAHLAILTESDLIWIRDDPSQQTMARSPYGGIWNYIPLAGIESVSLIPVEDDLLELSVHLSGQERLKIPYAATKKTEADKMCRRISERIR